MRNIFAAMLCMIALTNVHLIHGFLGIAICLLAGWILGTIAAKADQYDKVSKLMNEVHAQVMAAVEAAKNKQEETK